MNRFGMAILDAESPSSPVASKPNRQLWNYAARAQHAQTCAPLEDHFRERLVQWFAGESKLHIKPHTNPLHRHDVIVTHDDYPEKTVLLELECGKDQSQWVSNVLDNERRWKYGLNVLSRKIGEGKHFDLFIKYNLTGSSFFACTYEFAAKHGVVTKLRKTSLKFATDQTVFAIPWHTAKTLHSDFCMDDQDRLFKMILHVFQSQTSGDATTQ